MEVTLMVCRKCGEEFQPTERDILKRDFMCRPCNLAYKRAWRQNRRERGLSVSGSKTCDPEKKRLWLARYGLDPEVRTRKAAQMREYGVRPEIQVRRKARRAVRTALESGRLRRGPCAVCGHLQSQAHHRDYHMPLEVVWLCRKCHTSEHAKAEGRA